MVLCTLEFNSLDLCPLGTIRSFEVEVEVAEVEGVLAFLRADIAYIISRVIEVEYIGSLPLPLPLSLSNAVFGSTFSFTNPDLQ